MCPTMFYRRPKMFSDVCKMFLGCSQRIWWASYRLNGACWVGRSAGSYVSVVSGGSCGSFGSVRSGGSDESAWLDGLVYQLWLFLGIF